MSKDIKGFQANHDAEAYPTSGGTPEELVDGIHTEELQREEVLHQQPAFLSEVLKTIGALVIVLDRQGQIVSFNRACEEATGYSAVEVKGKYLWDFLLTPDEVEPVKTVFVQLQAGQFPNAYENYWLAKDGSRRLIAWSNTAITNPKGQVEYIIGTGMDITERKQAEEALRESEERFKAIASNTPDHLLVQDRELRYKLVINPQLGLTEKEMLGKTDYDILTPDDAKKLTAIKRKVLETGDSVHVETSAISRDGRPEYFDGTYVPKYDAQGNVDGVIGYFRNVTERKQVEKALQKSREDLNRAQAVGNIGSWRLDIQNNVLTWSDENHRMFGIPKGTPITYDTFLSTVHPDDRGYTNAKWESALAGEPYDIEHRIIVDGKIKWVSEKAYLEFDDKGTLLGGFGITQDITERKQMLEELKRSRDELEKRVQERTAELMGINESLRLEEARLDALLTLSKFSEDTLDKIASFILEQAIALTQSRIGFVGFLSDDEKVYTLHSVSKDVVKECNVEGNPVHWPVENAGIWADAIKERRTLFINDYSKPHPLKKGIPPGHVAIEKFMAVPLIENKKIVTIAGVGNKESDYDSSDERQIELLLSGMWGYIQRRHSRESILAERKRLFDVLETLPVMICLLTKDHHIAFANAPFKKKFGEDNGRHCFEYCFGKTEPCEFCESYKVLETGKPHHWEITSPDGLSVIDVYDFPFTDSDGSPMILEMDIDITEQRQAQEATKAERQRFYDVLETLPVYVCLLTPDYQMPFANRVFREWFGYYADKKCYEFLFNRTEPCEKCETYKVLKTSKPQRWEWIGPNGRNYDIFDFPFKDTDGSQLILEMGIDITERKKAQEALRATSLYARGLLEASLDPLVTISKEGKITDVNDATISVTGISRERLIGAEFSNYFTEPDKAKEVYKRVFEKGFVKDYPLTIRHKNGRLTDVLYNATVYKDMYGKVVGVFAVARDITEKKITETELEKYRLHLEDLVKQRTTELARSNNDLEQFAYVASHDLQEPLRAVSGFVSLLQHSLKNTLDEKTREYMDFTVDGVARMQSLINGLLEFSRLDTRGKPPEKTDSGKSLNEALLVLQSSIKESGAKITSDNLPTVSIDPVQLKQLFQNLISNAIKFRGDNSPKIHISADHENKAWRFAVKDNGIGIEPQYHDRIFMIFQRLHTRKKYPGTGIGLSLCKKIVERHGGNIWVESTLGRGSTFYFTIPDMEGAE